MTRALRDLETHGVFLAPHDRIVSPTYAPDLAQACLDLLLDGEHGVWRLASPGALSWSKLGQRIAQMAGLDTRRVQGRSGAELGLVAARPRFSALTSERGWLLPSLEDALTRYVHARSEPGWLPGTRAS